MLSIDVRYLNIFREVFMQQNQIEALLGGSRLVAPVEGDLQDGKMTGGLHSRYQSSLIYTQKICKEKFRRQWPSFPTIRGRFWKRMPVIMLFHPSFKTLLWFRRPVIRKCYWAIVRLLKYYLNIFADDVSEIERLIDQILEPKINALRATLLAANKI
jgi:hypothetical protein